MNTFHDILMPPLKRVLPLLGCIVLLTAMSLEAQPNATVVPYLSPGYRYAQVPWGGITGFEVPAYPDSAWNSGTGGFGSFADCPLNSSTDIHTLWTVNTDMLLRKTMLLPPGTANLRVSIAIDNDVQVFINGRDISGGLRSHEGCAERGSFVFVAPDSIIHGGENVLALRGRDRGVEAYLDAEVTADLPQLIVVGSTADSGPGSLREAIATANASPALDTLAFQISTEALVIINLLSPLPPITSPVIIDGTTQPGYGGSPLIVLNGQNAGPGAAGLEIQAGPSTVKGLVLNGFSGSGILLKSSNNTVAANYIGVNAAGSAASANGEFGVFIGSGSSGNLVGPGNVISGNGMSGVGIGGDKSTPFNNTILGNKIGTDASGSGSIPNNGEGVAVFADGTTIGGTSSGTGNIIAHNLYNGILIGYGTGNAILGNAIFANGVLGIDLNGDGVTLNVPPGTGFGANNRQNFPILSFAAFDLQGISGSMKSTASTTHRIEFFRNPVADGSGYGEGTTFLGGITLTTDSTGNAAFYQEYPGQLTAGEYITATATDAGNNTSEFSSAVLITARAKVFGNHYVVNTTLSGIPLHWPSGNGEFAVSTTVPSGFQNAIVQGYAAWSALPQVNHSYTGTTASTVWGGDPDGINNNVWVSSGWTALTGADENVVAVTRVRYNSLTGQITDADIAFDAEHFSWQDGGTESLGMDVRNAATHESGHVNGLGDIYNPGDPGYVPAMANSNEAVTMYGLLASGETSKQSLEAPDTAGIAYIYRSIPPEAVDLVLVFDGSASYAVNQQAFDASVNSALSLVPKMRTGDRLGVVKMPNTVVFPLTAMQDSATRSQASTALNALLPGGTSAIGSGLQTAQSMLASHLPGSAPAMILFSAGEENASPGALSVLGSVASAGTRVFTLGFPGSSGQGLCNTIADSTGGVYYQAADSTINQAVIQIWNTLTGQQYTFFTVAPSDTFQNVPQPGISWQGPVDKGTTTAQPGIQWQGPIKATLAQGPEALSAGSSYVLSLLPPGGATLIDSAYVANHPGLGIQFFSGPSFQYFTIDRPTPGTWTLYVYGRRLPSQPEPVAISISAFTDVTMDAGFDRIVYTPGETMGMNVSLSRGGASSPDRHTTGGGPIIDATVQARITPPGGGADAVVPFSNLGGGVYRGVFSNTLSPGTYNVRFLADADSIERTSDQAVYVIPPFDGRQVLLASNSIVALENMRVHSGDIIVNNRKRDPGVMPELILGDRTTTPAGFNLKADRVLVGRRSAIASGVFYNTLVNRGTITGALVTPLAIPVLPSLPAFRSPDPGNGNVSIGNGRLIVLAPGRYGEVLIQPKGTLRLTGGVYHFKSLWAKTKARIVCDAAAEIRIAGDLRADNQTYIGPSQGSLIDASDIVFYVVGGPGPGFFPKAVILGPEGSVFANFYAPFGTIALKEETRATGAFIADNILVGEEVDLTLDNAFSSAAAGPVIPWDREPVEDQGAGVPAAFSLAQNFPNPFNPTTTVRYQLAEASPVSLVVYDLLGQAVRELVSETQDAGTYAVVWDGRNNGGQAVGSGIFYCRLQAGSFVATRSMTLVK